MTERVFNFSAGPATLPLEALEEARRDLLALPGAGASILEISHRSPTFLGIIEEAKSNIARLLDLPPNYKIVFVPGGASMQFALLAMNFLRGSGKPADYIVTGTWGAKAIAAGALEGDARAAWDGKAGNYTRTPSDAETRLSDDPAYVHFTSNETIQGVQFATEPDAKGAPLICDASSDFLSRPIDASKYAMLYAGAQKNIGPSGVAAAILREDMLERVPRGMQPMLDYSVYVAEDSAYNTPPVFSIYMIALATRWLLNTIGGLEKIAAINEMKARLIYDAIDASGGFYQGHAAKECRSKMNVAFRLPSEELDKEFLAEAKKRNLTELKGHRSVGGMRASIYNAMPVEGCRALADFMRDFCAKKG